MSDTGGPEQHQDDSAGRDIRLPRWLPSCVTAAVGLFLFGAAVGVLGVTYDRFTMPETTSMSATLGPNAQVLVRPVPDGYGGPRRGDIVAFDPAEWRLSEKIPNELFIMRVVGLGGDTVACCDAEGRIQVNGRAIVEEYVGSFGATPGEFATMPFETTVPDGRVFLLGDTRDNSADSRVQAGDPDDGAISVSAIQGTVVGTLSVSGGVTPLSTNAFASHGPSTVDRLPVYAWWAAIAGVLVALAGFVWMAVTGNRRSSLSRAAARAPGGAPR